MIRLFQGHEAHKFPSITDDMHRLRARIFHDRMQWPVEVQDGRERDRFDDLDPLYIVSLGPQGNVRGTARLLPTTGPNMLSDVFPELLGNGVTVRSPTIWESSRFSVDYEKETTRTNQAISETTGEVLSAIVETGIAAGLEFIVTVMDVHVERVLRRAGCPCDHIGKPKRIGTSISVAALFEMNDTLLSSIKRATGVARNVVEDEDKFRLGLAS